MTELAGADEWWSPSRDGLWQLHIKAFRNATGKHEAGAEAKTYRRTPSWSDRWVKEKVHQLFVEVYFGGPGKRDDSRWHLERWEKREDDDNENEIAKRTWFRDPEGRAEDGTRFWVHGVVGRATVFHGGVGDLKTAWVHNGNWNPIFKTVVF